MLEALEQVKNKAGTITFKQAPQYDPRDPAVLNTVLKGIENDSPAILSVACYTTAAAKYINNNDPQINLIVDSQADLTRVLEAVKNNRHLTEFTLCGYEILHKDEAEVKADPGAEELLSVLESALTKNRSIKTLRLYHAKLAPPAVNAVVKGIENNRHISSLYLTESALFSQTKNFSTIGGIQVIVDALEKNHFITKIDLTNFKEFDTLRCRLEGSHFLAKIKKVAERNQEFANQCAELEKKFQALTLVGKKLLSANANETKESTPKINKEQEKLQAIKTKAEEVKISEIIFLLEEMLDIADNLEKTRYTAADEFLHRVKCAEAEFYFKTDQLELLLALERDHFAMRYDENFNFQLAEKIVAIDDPATLRSLGFDTERLKYQYIIALLEVVQNPAAVRLCKSAYLKLYFLRDDFNKQSLEKTIGVDRILTRLEFDQISKVFNELPFRPNFARFEKLVFHTKKCNLDSDPDVIASRKKYLEAELEPIQNTLAEHEKFTAEILIDIFAGKKITTYAYLRQKNAHAYSRTTSAQAQVRIFEISEACDDWNFFFFHWHAKEDDKLKFQFYWKNRLAQSFAQSFANGAYEKNIFNLPSVKNITGEHSRILSATRLATLPSEVTRDQMVKILQVEYAALPDEDKKKSASFFTSYRHRTLEKALEAVFEKEKIPLLKKKDIEEDERLQFAFKVFQWIGEQERSLYYKLSKNQPLFTSMQALGNLAHELIMCDKNHKTTLRALKVKIEEQIEKIPPSVDRRALEIAMLRLGVSWVEEAKKGNTSSLGLGPGKTKKD